MSSAIAARKARLAQSGEAQNTPGPAPTPATALKPTITTPTAPETPKSLGKSSSKRKSNSQVPLLSPEKQKRVKHKEKRPRYFSSNGDAFTKQQDVIVIEDEESSSSEENEQIVSLAASVSEDGMRTKSKRAWSPSNAFYDSSDDEAKNVTINDLLDIPVRTLPLQPSTSVALSTFQAIQDKNFLRLTREDTIKLGLLPSHNEDDVSVLLALAPGETVSLLGVYNLTVLAGFVSLCGTTLSASPIAHRVFAPRSSPIPVIKSMPSDSSDVRSDIPEFTRQIVRQGGSLVVLGEVTSHVEGLGRICRTFDGVFTPSRWQHGDTDVLGIKGAYLIRQPSRDIQTFSLPDSWDACLSSVTSETTETKTPVCLVKGPKNAGKSTFARTLLNRLLMRYSKVAFLECDLGQSEFTPGGMVALNVVDTPVFGPPFTHLSIPTRAHYVGSSTPRPSPSHYLSSIHALLQTYRLDIQFSADPDVESKSPKIADVIPLVVNVMGWTKGLGVDITRKIEEMVEPTDIFEFEVPVTEYVPSPHRRPAEGSDARLYTLEPIEPSVLSTNFSASDHRTISMLSYFHAVFPPVSLSSETSVLASPMVSSWNVSLPLCAQMPYEVALAEAFDRVYVTGAGSEDVIHAELLRVLNGAVVGLLTCDQGGLDIDLDMDDTPNDVIPYTRGAAPPSPLSSHCCGLALIRGVSETKSGVHLHILTSVSPVADARVLIKGELELPVWGMLDFRSEEGGSVAGVEKTMVPYLRWGREEGRGGERRRVRRNLMRRGQM
ncbi:hypothetical protein NEOLEDRAFT_1075377 [Neolentinus lepideus HHB14362 ss-1]|uniref:Polynucleotide 5'-hydroxyl-kinase GRC3 n=1 Tax=Neolentinus lepideus HHB14362 ss-1 TaxID=1314782 RepID=A0A165P5J6_9AGAM|nr:hypothetical protein NEOLEDRAFT_1075377 [Neolentinus lepideus HHB14362 ss-1]